MVHPAGVEPAAYGIGIRHSIQLELRVHMVGQANPVFISSAFLLPVFSIAISCRLFHRVFVLKIPQ